MVGDDSADGACLTLARDTHALAPHMAAVVAAQRAIRLADGFAPRHELLRVSETTVHRYLATDPMPVTRPVPRRPAEFPTAA
ncbi:MAG: hypothetical protein R2737_04855 [Candidatus Nanopelagicales bacterium]